MILYHGSKGGIKGDISPKSRSRCDFGSGFYMGEDELQTQILVCGDQNPVFYKVDFHIEAIPEERILRLKRDATWLNFVLLNRGYFNQLKGTKFYNDIVDLTKNKDVVIGPIADDGYRIAIRDFKVNDCSDYVLLNALIDHELGRQISILTEEACKLVSICEERIPEKAEIARLVQLGRKNREIGDERYRYHKRHYNHIGKRRDEIIKEVLNNERAKRVL